MAWIDKGRYIIGAMPNGPQRFNSFEEYENAWADAVFSSMNEFELEIPECW